MSCGSNIPDCLPCNDCPPAGVTYTLPNCPEGEKCEQVDSADCVGYYGPNLPALQIVNGERLTSVLLKLHRVVNGLLPSAVQTTSYTATATTSTPMVVKYLALGPVYVSTATATGSGTTINVGSTTGLVPGMAVSVVSGNGAFAPGTTVQAVTATSFSVSQAPTTPLTGGSVVRGVGSQHTEYTITVVQNAPQTFSAFIGSVVKVSGTGTIS